MDASEGAIVAATCRLTGYASDVRTKKVDPLRSGTAATAGSGVRTKNVESRRPVGPDGLVSVPGDCLRGADGVGVRTWNCILYIIIYFSLLRRKLKIDGLMLILVGGMKVKLWGGPSIYIAQGLPCRRIYGECDRFRSSCDEQTNLVCLSNIEPSSRYYTLLEVWKKQ